MSGFNSDINLPIPASTGVNSTDIALSREMQAILNSLRILQQELSAAKARITALETP